MAAIFFVWEEKCRHRIRKMADITKADLEAVLAGDPSQLDVHLSLVMSGQKIAGSETTVHCHCLTVDANGRVKIERLAEYLRSVLADYSIPKSKMEEAKERDAKFNSTSAVSHLLEEAKSLFTDLETTGEGGEVLLYVLAQHFLKRPQVLCKMDLKTSAKMHIHGSDGLYAGVTDDGVLKLYWGESKIHASVSDAVRECLTSIAPYLCQVDAEGSKRERDLVLLSDKADLSDPALTEAFKKYFDKTSVLSNQVKYCGIALVGFDVDYYPEKDKERILEEVVLETKKGFIDWLKLAEKRIPAGNLQSYEIELLFVPMPSVNGFRESFLKAIGAKK